MLLNRLLILIFSRFLPTKDFIRLCLFSCEGDASLSNSSEFIKDVCLIYRLEWFSFTAPDAFMVDFYSWSLVSQQKQEEIREKNVFVSKNITFYFQLQRETCNIFVTLLNKISKKHSRQ